MYQMHTDVVILYLILYNYISQAQVVKISINNATRDD